MRLPLKTNNASKPSVKSSSRQIAILGKKLSTLKLHQHDEDNEEDDKETAKKNVSIFQKRLKKIRRMRDEEGASEKLNTEILESLRDMVLDLIPIAEVNYRTFKIDKSAYALNTYVNQIREIENDLRAIEDFQTRADKIKDIVIGQFKYVLQNLMDELYKVQREMLEMVGDDHKQQEIVRASVKQMLKTHSQFCNQALMAINDKIDRYLVKE
jgi:hypothetical protein